MTQAISRQAPTVLGHAPFVPNHLDRIESMTVWVSLTCKHAS